MLKCDRSPICRPLDVGEWFATPHLMDQYWFFYTPQGTPTFWWKRWQKGLHSSESRREVCRSRNRQKCHQAFKNHIYLYQTNTTATDYKYKYVLFGGIKGEIRLAIDKTLGKLILILTRHSTIISIFKLQIHLQIRRTSASVRDPLIGTGHWRFWQISMDHGMESGKRADRCCFKGV